MDGRSIPGLIFYPFNSNFVAKLKKILELDVKNLLFCRNNLAEAKISHMLGEPKWDGSFALLNCSPAEVRLSVELFDGIGGLSDSLELDESASNHLAVGLLQDVDVDNVAALKKCIRHGTYICARSKRYLKSKITLL